MKMVKNLDKTTALIYTALIEMIDSKQGVGKRVIPLLAARVIFSNNEELKRI